MKNLVLIAAVGKNKELGCNNDLIWRFKEDLQYFRKVTMGCYIVMGQRTYYSLPPTLEGRKYIVISEKNIDGVMTFNNLNDFLAFAKKTDDLIWVVGGGMIYSQLLPHCGKMILTEIDASAKADVFFPKFDVSEWNIERGTPQTSPEGIQYRRNIYTRLPRRFAPPLRKQRGIT